MEGTMTTWLCKYRFDVEVCRMSIVGVRVRTDILLNTPPAARKISTRLLLGRRLNSQLLTLDLGRSFLNSDGHLIASSMWSGHTIEIFDGFFRVFWRGHIDKAIVSRASKPPSRITRGEDLTDGFHIVVLE